LANSSSTLQSFTYADAPDGDILTETDSPSSSGTSKTYTYDSQGRVASEAAGSVTTDYGFDESGNLTKLPEDATGTYNDAGELTASAPSSGTTTDYTYNADGERTGQTQSGTATMTATWNGAGELTSYHGSSGDMTSATYDGTGHRATATFTTGPATTESYVWAADTLLMDSTNAYIYGISNDTPGEQVNLSTGTITYVVTDSLGSIRGTVNTGGTLTATSVYDAWGNLSSTSATAAVTPFGYAGSYTDSTGLLYLINRYYDSVSGQFASLDPEVDQTLQPYGYADANPVSQNDPTGMDPSACRDQFHENAEKYPEPHLRASHGGEAVGAKPWVACVRYAQEIIVYVQMWKVIWTSGRSLACGT
jgi:RHS repeat-associated protein